MLRYILIILVFTIHLSLEKGNDIDFCREEYDCVNKKHTICQLKHNCGKGPNCKNYKNAPFTQKEKQALLDKHNEIRNKVALGKGLQSKEGIVYPTAANMREMVWDKELEFSAQCWANQCPEGHDPCRKKSDGLLAGQNLGYQTDNKKNNFLETVENFYKEARNMPIALIDSFQHIDKPVIGHFTQLVYWNSSQLGCARTKFSYQGFNGQLTNFLACNYAWAGNWLNDTVYKRGKPCSECPEGSKCHTKYEGLCSTEPSKSKIPSICKFSSDKNCKAILGPTKKDKGKKKEEQGKEKGKKDGKKGKGKKGGKKSKGKKKKGKGSGEDEDNDDKSENTRTDESSNEDRDSSDLEDGDDTCIIERRFVVLNESPDDIKNVAAEYFVILLWILYYNIIH